MRSEIKSEAGLHAEEFLGDAGKVAIVGAHDFVIAHAESGLASVGTVRADRGDIFHLPRAGFVAIGAAGERTDRADIDAHAAFFAIEVIAFIGNDDGVRPAHAHAEGLHIHTFVAHANASIAKDAAWRVVINQVRPFLFRPVNFFFREAAGIGAIAKYHVLQFALAAFVAYRAIERVIR